MLRASLLALAAASSAVLADVVPTSPDSTTVCTVGSTCTAQFNLDTTGNWTDFSITLKSGANLNMIALETLASGLDGTTGATSFDFTTPDVTVYSKIYFLEFAQTGQATAWTTRFTIAGTDGTTTTPTNTTDSVAWGTGALVSTSGSSSSAAASGSSASSTSASSASSASAASSSSSSSSASSSSSSSSATSSFATVTSSASSAATSAASAAQNAASSAASKVSSAAASATSAAGTSGAGRMVATGGLLGLVGAGFALLA